MRAAAIVSSGRTPSVCLCVCALTLRIIVVVRVESDKGEWVDRGGVQEWRIPGRAQNADSPARSEERSARSKERSANEPSPILVQSVVCFHLLHHHHRAQIAFSLLWQVLQRLHHSGQ